LSETLDLRGLLCPLPVFKARKRLDAMASGETLILIATDPMTAIDVPHFCGEQGHELVSQEQRGADYVFAIKRR
jgi:tRNA 2-thiouridine synthesizing protein A